MGSLLVIAGPPGAGKSTVAQLLADRAERSVLVQGDAFFGFLASGAIEPWQPAADEQNGVTVRAAASAAGVFASGGYTTIYDGVVGPWSLSSFLDATGLQRLSYAVLLPPVEACVDRVASRSGHGFTSEPATRQMHATFADSTLDTRHRFLEPADPDRLAAHIATAQAAGTLDYPR